MTRLDAWNALAPEEAAAAILPCAGSRRWARRVAGGRPYADATALLDGARNAWHGLEREDWLEAFASHPRIGERATHGGDRARAWSTGEQTAARTGDENLSRRLAEGNRAYEACFGHVYLVCATGRSAPDLLATLERRLGHAPEDEFREAVAEGEAIMALRLGKWLSE